MTIAELFVNIGIKGDGSAKKGLEGVQRGLTSIRDAGIAAKAAVIAVLYGLERMTAAAGKRGMELRQFATATGLSAETLQKWQYAAQSFGVEADEVAGAVVSVQKAMTNMRLGLGAPEGFAQFSRAVKLDQSRLTDTFYLMKKIQEYSKMGDPSITRRMIESLGISDRMFGFLRGNKLDIDKIRPSNIFSNKEIERLAQVDAAWNKLWNRLKLISGGQVAKFGFMAIDEINNLVSGLMKISKAISSVARQIPNFNMLLGALAGAGAAVALAFAPVTATVTAIGLLIADLNKGEKGFLGQAFKPVEGWLKSKNLLLSPQSFVEPSRSSMPQAPAPTQKDVNIKVEQNFQHEGKNRQELKNASKDGIFSAYRSLQAQTQVS